MSIINLERMLHSADDTDWREGRLAYYRYRQMMQTVANHYSLELENVVAAFVALSPSNDYIGNLRSLVSLIEGVLNNKKPQDITVTTYKKCRDRAFQFLTGKKYFPDYTKGLKTRAFYFNILDPEDNDPVTIDGHMIAAWCGQEMTMKQAQFFLRKSKTKYNTIAQDTRDLAKQYGVISNQIQAVVWFARKRTLQIKYSPQLSLFGDRDDQWGIIQPLEQIQPYVTR